MEQQPRLPLWFLPANMALIAAAFFLGLLIGGRRLASIPEPQRSALDLVHATVLRSHVDTHDAGALIDDAIAGMVRGLDPYSLYVPPSKVQRYEEATTGHYEGIGAEFHVYGDAVVLWFPLPGGPAEAAGLQPGDRLIAVDGKALDTEQLRLEVNGMVRGAAGTEVRLRLQRGDGEREVTVRRGDVQRACVKWAQLLDAEAGLGYVHLTDFHPGSSKQLLAAIASLQQQQPLRGLVLDLRFDSGGSFDECIRIARAFIAKGTIVTQQRRDDAERHEARAEECTLPDLPLVVLVNQFSASASEVLAGALQDHGRAAIVGVRTHGKACVNTVYTWENLDFRLKLTTGRYRTPNGRDIERNFGAPGDGKATGGIPPDIEVEVNQAQREALRQTLGNSEVPARWREPLAAAATQYQFTVPTPPTPADDAQLAAALTALRARAAAPAANVPADK